MKSKIKRLEAFSTGGGGGNIIRKIAAMLKRMNLGNVVGYTVIDTNKKSLDKTISLFPEEIRPNVRYKKLGLGNGSGCDPASARRDIENEKTAAELLQMVEGDTFEAAPVFGTLGKGTATGTLLPILKILRRAKVMAFGVVVKCSQEYGEVEEAQDNAAEEAIRELDESGIPYILAMNRAAYIESEKSAEEKITREKAYRIIDEEIANSLRAFLRVLADPDQADREDIRKLIYAGGNEGRKRWRLGTVELSKDFTEEDLTEAIRQCFENQRFDFDNSRIGGTLVIREGEFAAHEVAAMNLEMRSIINGWSNSDRREVTNTHYRLVEAEYPSISENYVNITFLFSEYNGNPDLESLPEIRWADEATDGNEDADGKEDPTMLRLENLNREIQKQDAHVRTNGAANNDWRKLAPVSSNRDRKEFHNLHDFLASYNVGNPAAKELVANNDIPPFHMKLEDILNSGGLLKEAKKQGLKSSWYDNIFEVLSAGVKLSQLSGHLGPGRSVGGFDNKNPVPTLDMVKAVLSKKALSQEDKQTCVILKLAIELLPTENQATALNSFRREEPVVEVKPGNGIIRKLWGGLPAKAWPTTPQ